MYFIDTGLAAYLTKWNTSEVLEAAAMAGAFFESFSVLNKIKDIQVGNGAVICMYDKCIKIDGNNSTVPIMYL